MGRPTKHWMATGTFLSIATVRLVKMAAKSLSLAAIERDLQKLLGRLDNGGSDNGNREQLKLQLARTEAEMDQLPAEVLERVLDNLLHLSDLRKLRLCYSAATCSTPVPAPRLSAMYTCWTRAAIAGSCLLLSDHAASSASAADPRPQPAIEPLTSHAACVFMRKYLLITGGLTSQSVLSDRIWLINLSDGTCLNPAGGDDDNPEEAEQPHQRRYPLPRHNHAMEALDDCRFGPNQFCSEVLAAFLFGQSGRWTVGHPVRAHLVPAGAARSPYSPPASRYLTACLLPASGATALTMATGDWSTKTAWRSCGRIIIDLTVPTARQRQPAAAFVPVPLRAPDIGGQAQRRQPLVGRCRLRLGVSFDFPLRWTCHRYTALACQHQLLLLNCFAALQRHFPPLTEPVVWPMQQQQQQQLAAGFSLLATEAACQRDGIRHRRHGHQVDTIIIISSSTSRASRTKPTSSLRTGAEPGARSQKSIATMVALQAPPGYHGPLPSVGADAAAPPRDPRHQHRPRCGAGFRQREPANLPLPKFKYDEYYFWPTVWTRSRAIWKICDADNSAKLKRPRCTFHPQSKKHLGIGRVLFTGTRAAGGSGADHDLLHPMPMSANKKLFASAAGASVTSAALGDFDAAAATGAGAAGGKSSDSTSTSIANSDPSSQAASWPWPCKCRSCPRRRCRQMRLLLLTASSAAAAAAPTPTAASAAAPAPAHQRASLSPSNAEQVSRRVLEGVLNDLREVLFKDLTKRAIENHAYQQFEQWWSRHSDRQHRQQRDRASAGIIGRVGTSRRSDDLGGVDLKKKSLSGSDEDSKSPSPRPGCSAGSGVVCLLVELLLLLVLCPPRRPLGHRGRQDALSTKPAAPIGRVATKIRAKTREARRRRRSVAGSAAAVVARGRRTKLSAAPSTGPSRNERGPAKVIASRLVATRPKMTAPVDSAAASCGCLLSPPQWMMMTTKADEASEFQGDSDSDEESEDEDDDDEVEDTDDCVRG
uniref:F-box domain-containing protein n=1 Tax=Macrostomum lignano TaxID=282301 RepID=A0A1I8FNT3_9PLAT